MNIVVISDKNNEKRRANVIKEFGKYNLEFKFFDAIMANRMSKEELDNKAIKNTFLSPSEIGCALSHCGVYEEFLKSDEKSIMICEDDLYFTDDFSIDAVQKIMSFVELNDKPSVVVLQKSIYHAKKIKNIDRALNIYSSRNLFGTYGYIINRAAAQNIKNVQTPVTFEIDAYKFYYWLDACNLYCLNKDLILSYDIDVLEVTITKNWTSDRKSKKDKAYKKLYQNLTLKGKIISQWRRFTKALHKPFETLDY
ncbi:glycosyltransferase family 25 protein [Veillonella sp.]